MKFRTPHTENTYYLFNLIDEFLETPDEFLTIVSKQRLARRSEMIDRPAYGERLNQELQVGSQHKIALKLLILKNIADEATEKGFVIECPSLAGSLIAYLLRLTAIDPLEHDLAFDSIFDGDLDYRLEVTMCGSASAELDLFPTYEAESYAQYDEQDPTEEDVLDEGIRFGLGKAYVTSLPEEDHRWICKLDWVESKTLADLEKTCRESEITGLGDIKLELEGQRRLQLFYETAINLGDECTKFKLEFPTRELARLGLMSDQLTDLTILTVLSKLNRKDDKTEKLLSSINDKSIQLHYHSQIDSIMETTFGLLIYEEQAVAILAWSFDTPYNFALSLMRQLRTRGRAFHQREERIFIQRCVQDHHLFEWDAVELWNWLCHSMKTLESKRSLDIQAIYIRRIAALNAARKVSKILVNSSLI